MTHKVSAAPSPSAPANQVSEAFAASRFAYGAYLAGGRTFAAAIRIRSANDHLRHMLSQAVFPQKLQHDRLHLLLHLEAWTRSWDETRARLSPAPDDSFAFPTTIPFPRESETRILSFLEKTHPPSASL